MLAEGGIAAAIGGEPRTPLQHSPYPCGEGRLAVGEVRMRDAGLELELAITQDRCLTL
jgi:hypothetical protein